MNWPTTLLLGIATACRSDIGISTLEGPEPTLPEATIEPAIEVPEPGGEGPSGPDASTKGRSFLAGYMEDATTESQWFELWIESARATSGSFFIGDDGIANEFLVEPGHTRVAIPFFLFPVEPRGSGGIQPRGLRIETDHPVQIVAFAERGGHSEATRLLPVSELGFRYRALTVQQGDGAIAEFAIVAGRNDTVVTIVPRADTLDGRRAGVPYAVELDSGELHQLQSTGDLSGTEIISSRGVAVFGGGRDPVVDCDESAHVWEQLPPVTRWATDWLAAPWVAEQPYGYALVTADRDGTEVTVDCEAEDTLAAGDTLQIALESVSRIRSNHPVLVTQLSLGGACGPTSAGNPNLQLATPTLLSRPDLVIRPIGEDRPEIADDSSPEAMVFAEVSAQRERAIVFVEEPTALTVEPAQPPIMTLFDGLTAARFDVIEQTSLAHPTLRGFVYGATEFDGYSYSMGWDCVGCADALQQPATCD